ncbi:MAG: DMT family transporter [Rhodovibrionaceae bacterium]
MSIQRPEPLAAPAAQPLTGILLVCGAMTVVPVMDGIAKYLSSDFPVLQIVWARYFFHFLILLPVLLWRYGPTAFQVPRPGVQILRGGLLLASTLLFFLAISTMPLADALALVFVSPLVVTALSPLILKEPVGIRRWSAVVVGFLGALIIIRPGFEVFSGGALLALAAGCVYGSYLLATRKLSRQAPPLVTLGYTALLGAVVMTAVLPFVWVTPAWDQLALMLAMGLIAACGHFMLIKGFEHAEAAVLAPCTYFEIIMMTLVGYVAFGDFPDSWTWVGIAVIVASGLYTSWRERVRRVA